MFTVSCHLQKAGVPVLFFSGMWCFRSLIQVPRVCIVHTQPLSLCFRDKMHFEPLVTQVEDAKISP